MNTRIVYKIMALIDKFIGVYKIVVNPTLDNLFQKSEFLLLINRSWWDQLIRKSQKSAHFGWTGRKNQDSSLLLYFQICTWIQAMKEAKWNLHGKEILANYTSSAQYLGVHYPELIVAFSNHASFIKCFQNFDFLHSKRNILWYSMNLNYPR